MEQVFPYNFDLHDLSSIIDHSAIRYHDNIAIMYEHDNKIIKIPYKQLKKDIDAVCYILSDMSYCNKFIALHGQLSYSWIVVFFAILKINSTVICASEENFMSQAFYEIQSQRMVKHIVHASNCPHNNKYEKLMLEDIMKSITDIKNGKIKRFFDYKICDEPRPAVILFTSGTTGESKPVCLSHNNLANDVLACQYMLKRNSEDRLFSCLPTYHSFELTVGILTPLFVGASICISKGLKYLFNDIKKYCPTIIPVVPLMAETIKNRVSFAAVQGVPISNCLGNSLNTIVSGGSHLKRSTLDFFRLHGIKCLTGYGITECSPVISCGCEIDTPPNSVGKTSPYCQARIINGEICIKGDIVAIPNFNGFNNHMKFNDEWYRTGDAGYIDDAGNIFITGRMDEMLVLNNGEIISPVLIEQMIKSIDAVEDVLCFQVVDFEKNELIAITKLESRYLENNKFYDKIRHEIMTLNYPYHVVIKNVIFIKEDFPVTETGKVRRRYIKMYMEDKNGIQK